MSLLALRSFASGTLFGSYLGEGSEGSPGSGSGLPRIIYLHGWGRTHRDFDLVRTEVARANAPATSLPAGATAPATSPPAGATAPATSPPAGATAPASIALDLPGFGASPPPPSAGGAELYARLVLPVLSECELPVLVVGHSFGGRVALELAYQRPDAIAALVLTGVPLLRPAIVRRKPTMRFRMARWAHQAGLFSNQKMEELRARSGSADYQAAQGVMRNVLVCAVNETYEKQLAAVTAPVELVWGSEDSEVLPGIGVRAETMLSNASLTIMPEVGHLVPTEAPIRLADIIKRQLHTLSGSSEPAATAASTAAGTQSVGTSPPASSSTAPEPASAEPVTTEPAASQQ